MCRRCGTEGDEPSSDNCRVTSSGRPPEQIEPGAPAPIDPATGQHKDYWVLSEAERAKGFVRPVRQTYKHKMCGTTTRMGLAIAETYARDPKFYGATFCCNCSKHFPVSEFEWDGSHQLVGS